MRHAVLLVVLLAVLPALAGCDASPGRTFDLPRQVVTFEFRFQGGTLSPDQPTTVTSQNQVNLRAFVESQGFTGADVVRARVENPRLTVSRPLAASVAHLAEVQLRPVVSGQPGPVVAAGSGFTGTGLSASLSASGADLASAVVAGPFGAQLQVRPTAAILAQEYVVEVRLEVVVEVEA